ncbi:TetR family transcriptional regulator [Tomitella cavernea]|uniref:TetR family transcriptional regulator n=1 Tax=Tomitella cavernea TaxID=1387982 RepID=A0ABP9CI26_9ACTN|nr:TetR family transcriptional regulator [Tomitella cavernea]
MPRIAEARVPAEPSSKLQWEKYRRMLDTATELAEEKEFERVQMHDVAKQAGIAIGTLYRYFPSKTHLFVGVMAREVEDMRSSYRVAADPCQSPQEAVAVLSTRALRALMRRPLLASAMVRSINTARVDTVLDSARVDAAFDDAVLEAARIDTPTEHDEQLLRLLNQQWLGVLQSCLNGHVTQKTAEVDLQAFCRILLRSLSSAVAWRETHSD